MDEESGVALKKKDHYGILLIVEYLHLRFKIRKVKSMAVSYNGLWKLLIDKNMQKKYLT